MKIAAAPSPNFNDRPGGEISMLVLHYTGMKTAGEALQRLTDPKAQVSAHYLIDEQGNIFALVDEEKRAWHAGVSRWRGRDGINDISIGIEIANPGHEWGYVPFPGTQMEAVCDLSRRIIARHGIAARNIVGHADIAPARKEDPGELFDWKWLAVQGVGLWPDRLHEKDETPDIADLLYDCTSIKSAIARAAYAAHSLCVSTNSISYISEVQRRLADYGYDCPLSGQEDMHTQKVILAFQRHFRPAHLSGSWDIQCENILAALLEMT